MIVEPKEGIEKRRTDTKIIHLTYQLNYIHLILMGINLYRNQFQTIKLYSVMCARTNGN